MQYLPELQQANTLERNAYGSSRRCSKTASPKRLRVPNRRVPSVALTARNRWNRICMHIPTGRGSVLPRPFHYTYDYIGKSRYYGGVGEKE
jgi:hypothetical protein